jgi:hypothetical protein
MHIRYWRRQAYQVMLGDENRPGLVRMSEHQKETAFLRQVIRFDDTNERHELEARMVQVQRDQRSVCRAAWIVAMFAALGMAGLAYGAIFQESFPYGPSQLLVNVICELGLGALISLAAFGVLLAAYRRRLNHLRAGCRGLVMKLLECRHGPLRPPPADEGTRPQTAKPTEGEMSCPTSQVT